MADDPDDTEAWAANPRTSGITNSGTEIVNSVDTEDTVGSDESVDSVTETAGSGTENSGRVGG